MQRTGSEPAISCIIPTRNRRDALEQTLTTLTRGLDERDEIIVIDNSSTDGTVESLRGRFSSVRWIELDINQSAASRNVGASAANGDLLVMLDDDSIPVNGTIAGLRHAFASDPELGAVAGRIRLADRPERHDMGGLAGVIVNCGAAIRREAFLGVGGYPTDFHYYAEEYDLCCRLWRGGWRVEPRGDLHFTHARSPLNRNPDRLLKLLVRNNMKVWSRFAPTERRVRLLNETIDRYRHVARTERAEDGFEEGLAEWERESSSQPDRRWPMTEGQFERMFGLDRARERLVRQKRRLALRRVGVWGRGKGCPQLLELLGELGFDVAGVYEINPDQASWFGVSLRPAELVRGDRLDALIPGSLSLGAAEDLAADLRTMFPELPIVPALTWTTCRAATAQSSAVPA